jgi:VanZ family protein
VAGILKLIFQFSILLLIIISLYPGSLLGLLFYGDLSIQPTLIKNPFGGAINHFISYFLISIFGFILYFKSKKFKRVFYSLLVLSVSLEVLQLLIPDRTYETYDLFANILGVALAYFAIKIYLSFKQQ